MSRMMVCRLRLADYGTSEYPPPGPDACIDGARTCPHYKPHHRRRDGSGSECKGWCSGLAELDGASQPFADSCIEVPVEAK